MKLTKDNLKLLDETEDQLYRLRDEMSDKNENDSPINPMIDWIQKEKKFLRVRI